MKIKIENVILSIVGIFVIAYLYSKNQQQEEKIKELLDEREDLNKLVSIINENNDFNAQMKNELEELVIKYKDIDNKIAIEITEAIQLFQINQHENGIKSMVKIMEHLLSRKFENDINFLTWLKEKKKQKTLNEMLEYSNSTNLINKDEHRFFIAIKEIRNRESHEVGYEAPELIRAAGFLCGLHAIFKISAMVYPNKFISK